MRTVGWILQRIREKLARLGKDCLGYSHHINGPWKVFLISSGYDAYCGEKKRREVDQSKISAGWTFFFLLNLGGFYLFSSFCHFRYQCFYLAELIYGSLLRPLLWNFQNGLFESFTLVDTSCRTACAGSRQPQKKSLCSK